MCASTWGHGGAVCNNTLSYKQVKSTAHSLTCSLYPFLMSFSCLMVPRKGTTGAKHKEKEVPRQSTEQLEEVREVIRLSQAHLPPGLVGKKDLESILQFVAGEGNEGGATVVKDASTLDIILDELDIPIFDCFLMAGLVLPLSGLCHAVVSTYALHPLHIHL